MWPPWKELKLQDLVYDAIVKVDDIHAAVLGENMFPDVMLDAKNAMEVNTNDMKEMSQDSTLAMAGEKSCTGETFDVFIDPMIRDLQKLLDGVLAIDMSKEVDTRNFTLRCILLWTVHDFLAYGLISGQQVKGYRRCLICMEDTDAKHSSCLHI
jgi:hypothetical protein